MSAAVMLGGAVMTIPNCLAYRLYLLTGEHVFGFQVSPGLFHFLQIANYAVGIPAIYFLYNAQVPMPLIPPDKDPLLLNPSVGYYSAKLHPEFAIGIGCALPFIGHAALIALISTLKIFRFLRASPKVSKKNASFTSSGCAILSVDVSPSNDHRRDTDLDCPIRYSSGLFRIRSAVCLNQSNDIHTFAILTETWLVYTELTGLLPEMALYSGGYLATLGISGHYAIVSAAIMTGGASMTIPNCLAYRLYLLTQQHIFGFQVSPGLFHFLQLANYALGIPAIYFLYNGQVPKALIPLDKDPLLLNPSVGYYNAKLNAKCAIGIGCSLLFVGCIALIASISLIKIFRFLRTSPKVSKRTRALHRRAVHSCLLLSLPPMTMAAIPAYVALYAVAAAYLEFDQSYALINHVIVPLYLGVSIPLMANTLYSALWHKRSSIGNLIQVEKTRITEKLTFMWMRRPKS
ncbi:unnamed protein product, partial [Mesorhabditis spiculigera]